MTDALVAVPLLVERLALGRSLPVGLRVGRGPGRAAAAAADIGSALDSGGYAGLLVVGTCGGLSDRMRPGDLVVASEVHGAGVVVRCVGFEPLAAALRGTGRTVHIGPIHTTDHLVHGAEREQLLRTGAIAADTESALLAAAAGGRPVAVVRAVSDTPSYPLLSPSVVQSGLAALGTLRAAAPLLARWTVPARDRRDDVHGPTRTQKEVG